MASYFIGSNNTSSGFGGGGNFFAQLGQIGPAWQNTMLQGLNTQNAFNEFQNKQIVDPYRVNAAASSYAVQGLQNLYNANELNNDIQAQRIQNDVGSRDAALQQYRNMGYNPDQIQYGQNLVRQAPTQAQPVQAAQTGGYAATSPQLGAIRPQALPRPPQGYASWQEWYDSDPSAAAMMQQYQTERQSAVAPQYQDPSAYLF